MFFKEENIIQLGVKELAWIFYNKGLFDRIKPVLFVGHPKAACYHRHHRTTSLVIWCAAMRIALICSLVTAKWLGVFGWLSAAMTQMQDCLLESGLTSMNVTWIFHNPHRIKRPYQKWCPVASCQWQCPCSNVPVFLSIARSVIRHVCTQQGQRMKVIPRTKRSDV